MLEWRTAGRCGAALGRTSPCGKADPAEHSDGPWEDDTHRSRGKVEAASAGAPSSWVRPKLRSHSRTGGWSWGFALGFRKLRFWSKDLSPGFQFWGSAHGTTILRLGDSSSGARPMAPQS